MAERCQECGEPADATVDAPLCPDHYRQTLDRVRAELSGGWHAGAAKTRKARKRRLQFEADDELEVEAGISTQAG